MLLRVWSLGTGSMLDGRDASAAAASPARRAASAKPSAGRQRVAIIGAGAGGVAPAYFLGPTHDVDLFEARSKIGGHCDSHVIDYRGQRLTVDVGAQFFHPDTHPIYVTLLERSASTTGNASISSATYSWRDTRSV
jgi:predicted NAD/FAD-binding protein